MAVVAAVTMPIVVGGFGLGAEVGYWYFNQRKVQSAADMAAYAGAVTLRSDKPSSQIEAAAAEAAEETGYVGSRGTIDTATPPATGGFVGDAAAVEVTVQENLPRMFTALFADGPVEVSGRAVARITEGQQTCVLALDKHASGAVTFIGSTSAILYRLQCALQFARRRFGSRHRSATVQTPCMSAAGTVSVDEGLTLGECVAPYEHADQADDPYADLAVPALTEPARRRTPSAAARGDLQHHGGRYCGGMNIQRTVNMAPGMYVVDGGTSA